MPETDDDEFQTASGDALGALFGACRALIVEKGFGALSLRAVARVSGWTLGELAYRVGAKDQLISAYLAHELVVAKARDQLWVVRLAGVIAFDGPILAATVDAVVGDIEANGRCAAIVWHEAMLEAANGTVPSAPVAQWLDDRRAHWVGLLKGRHPQYALFGKVIADYIVAEQIYSAALSAEPAYRLIRSACVARLCGARGSGDWSGWESFLPPSSAWPSQRTHNLPIGRQGQAVADAAGQLIVAKGPSAVTHRAVAAHMGQSSSAIAHHFSTRLDLMTAGFDSLFQNVHASLQKLHGRQPPGGEPQAGASIPAAVGFVRAMHIIALVAARDAAFVPLMLGERASRGRMIEAWYGGHLMGPHRTDRLLLQIISLIAGVRTLEYALHGDVAPGGDRDALAEMLAVMK